MASKITAQGRAAARIDSVADAQALARRRLPTSLYQAVEGGAAKAVTQSRNEAAFDDVSFRPRAGVWSPTLDLGVKVLGQDLSLPLIIAPTGNLGVYHRDGERGVARAAVANGAAMCVGTLSGTPIEDVAAAAGPGASLFYQLYFLRDRDTVEYAIERAKQAGCKALVLTLDGASHVARERPAHERVLPVFEARSSLWNMLRFAPQAAGSLAWVRDFLRDPGLLDAPMARSRAGETMDFLQAFGQVFVNHLPPPTWEDFVWIREAWGGPIVAKGILSADDARRAVDAGASAVVVSNHGGMTCDGAPASLRVLPGIVDAVGGQTEVLFDSGVRRGLDVLKAVALGARAVMIGHAYVWPLAAAGEAGVARILSLFRGEMEQGLRYLGCPSIGALDRSYLTDWPGRLD